MELQKTQDRQQISKSFVPQKSSSFFRFKHQWWQSQFMKRLNMTAILKLKKNFNERMRNAYQFRSQVRDYKKDCWMISHLPPRVSFFIRRLFGHKILLLVLDYKLRAITHYCAFFGVASRDQNCTRREKAHGRTVVQGNGWCFSAAEKRALAAVLPAELWWWEHAPAFPSHTTAPRLPFSTFQKQRRHLSCTQAANECGA